MCREKASMLLENVVITGSPLRVQGKDSVKFCGFKIFRITPACAGKSVFAYISKILTEDHPCVCREKVSAHVKKPLRKGSPLRVQGKAASPASSSA